MTRTCVSGCVVALLALPLIIAANTGCNQVYDLDGTHLLDNKLTCDCECNPTAPDPVVSLRVVAPIGRRRAGGRDDAARQRHARLGAEPGRAPLREPQDPAPSEHPDRDRALHRQRRRRRHGEFQDFRRAVRCAGDLQQCRQRPDRPHASGPRSTGRRSGVGGRQTLHRAGDSRAEGHAAAARGPVPTGRTPARWCCASRAWRPSARLSRQTAHLARRACSRSEYTTAVVAIAARLRIRGVDLGTATKSPRRVCSTSARGSSARSKAWRRPAGIRRTAPACPTSTRAPAIRRCAEAPCDQVVVDATCSNFDPNAFERCLQDGDSVADCKHFVAATNAAGDAPVCVPSGSALAFHAFGSRSRCELDGDLPHRGRRRGAGARSGDDGHRRVPGQAVSGRRLSRAPVLRLADGADHVRGEVALRSGVRRPERDRPRARAGRVRRRRDRLRPRRRRGHRQRPAPASTPSPTTPPSPSTARTASRSTSASTGPSAQCDMVGNVAGAIGDDGRLRGRRRDVLSDRRRLRGRGRPLRPAARHRADDRERHAPRG